MTRVDPEPSFVSVVSGPPRSGTSLMMQMLEAGGIAPLRDAARPPDAGNPRGYYELEAVKRLPEDADWIAGAPGRAVKVVHALVTRLPAGPRYRILWMERDLGEVVRSQNALLKQLDRAPGDDLPDERIAQILAQQLDRAAAAIDARADIERRVVSHAALLAEPSVTAAQVAEFLGVDLDRDAMSRAVDPTLHRVRASP